MQLNHATMGERYWQVITNYFQQTCPSDNLSTKKLNLDLQGEIIMARCLSRAT